VNISDRHLILHQPGHGSRIGSHRRNTADALVQRPDIARRCDRFCGRLGNVSAAIVRNRGVVVGVSPTAIPVRLPGIRSARVPKSSANKACNFLQ